VGLVKHFIYCELPNSHILFCSVISSWTPLFYLTVLNFVLFFSSKQNRKINEDSKNVLKIIIFLLQLTSKWVLPAILSLTIFSIVHFLP